MSRRPQVLAGVALLCVVAVVLVSTDGLSQSLQLGTSSGNAVPGTMSLSVRSRRYKYRFYIYEELNNVAPTSKSIFKAGCGYTCLLYVCITAPLYKLARNHPARTHNASEATLFIVPFSVEGSYYGGQCDGRSHHDRLNLVIRFLKASPHFRAKKGANHFWPILFWMFGRDGFGFFQNDAITKVRRRLQKKYSGELTKFFVSSLLRVARLSKLFLVVIKFKEAVFGNRPSSTKILRLSRR